ncbi:MAG: hypothetical protein GX444_07590 [Myxococcales bacterium]|nr:hypothetical protein [Myxococcales bacterium]
MDEEQLRKKLAPPAPPAPDPALLEREEELWAKVTADLGKEEPHKEYLGLALKNNLLLQASRRYGSVIDAKDRYSIEQRRVARKYQQNILRILFLAPKEEKIETKLGSLEALILFLATIGMLGGAAAFFSDNFGIASPILVAMLRMMFPLGLCFVVVFIWVRIRRAKSFADRHQQ